MTSSVKKGPLVGDEEDLYRGITKKEWWVEEEGRPSSAAFRFPDFSVDIASIAGSIEHTLKHLPTGFDSGLVQFNCGAARELNFETRKELDPQNPSNHAHANVYSQHGSNQRKKAAQKLAQHCIVKKEPEL